MPPEIESVMLEQVLADAEALRSSVAKSVEHDLLERYKPAIRDAVLRILEQDDAELDDVDDIGEDEPDLGAEDEDDDADLGLEMPDMPPTGDEAEDGGLEYDTDMVEELPEAALSDNVEDEIIIDLDGLRQEMAALAGEPKDHEQAADDAAGVSAENTPPPSDAVVAVAESADGDGDDDDDDEIELDEADLAELVEELDVQLNGAKPSGWLGVPEQDMANAADLNLLQLQGDAAQKEIKTTKAALQRVMKENLQLTESKKQLQQKFNELQKSAEKTLNSNIKLLYINKVLVDPSLNEQQRAVIADQVNRTKTAEETKLIYETLYNTVGSLQPTAPAKAKRGPQSLVEAANVARRVSPLAMTSRRHAEETTQDPMRARFQQLANIPQQKGTR